MTPPDTPEWREETLCEECGLPGTYEFLLFEARDPGCYAHCDRESCIAALNARLRAAEARAERAEAELEAARAAEARAERYRGALEEIDERGTNGAGEAWTRDARIARRALAGQEGA